jgi:4-hydroxy-2-oxoheptanedioate aldolase
MAMAAPENKLKKQLAAGARTTGVWLSLANGYAAELVGTVGFDWVLIDGEHAPNDIRSTVEQLQALKGSSSSIVARPPVSDVHLIKQYLDIGVQSLLLPMIESGQQAELMVKAVRYGPRGVRGVGASLARASMFNSIPDYMATADDQICLMLQVESRAGLAALDDIARTDGVDCVFIGPSDLSADMGYPGNYHAPEVEAAIADAIKRIQAAGKAVGIYMPDPLHAKRYRDMGVNFIAVGAEASVLIKALRDLKEIYA